MKRTGWLLFLGAQVSGCLLTGANELFVRQLGSALMLPATLLLFVLPNWISNHITDRMMFEVAAVIIFFSINAVSWIVVYRYLIRRGLGIGQEQ
jgi:predicted branched-subunit amino acid permease